jgi:hypothetical protein
MHASQRGYREGFAAYKAREAITPGNPYPIHTAEWEHWRKGWLQACRDDYAQFYGEPCQCESTACCSACEGPAELIVTRHGSHCVGGYALACRKCLADPEYRGGIAFSRVREGWVLPYSAALCKFLDSVLDEAGS